MKIGLVFDDSLDRTDGVAQYVFTLGTWLASQKHEVHYLVGETKRRDIPNVHSLSRNVKVRFNQNRLTMPLPASRRGLGALLAFERFDILHVQMPYSPALAGRIIKLAGPHTAVVGTFHILPASPFVVRGNRLLARVLAPTLKRFAAVISNSKPSQAFAKSAYGLTSKIIPLGLDVAPFAHAVALSKYRNGKNVIFLGRLVERKGCHHLLSAVAKLVRDNVWPDGTRVIICGDGPQRLKLTEFVHEAGLTEIVSFAGFIPEISKARYLAAADIAVFPSTGGESFGVVLIEAMAACRGTVLAGNNPGYSAVLHDRPSQLFDPRDSDTFAAKLLDLLGNDSQRKHDHIWQRHYVRRFDISGVGKKTLSIYKQALKDVRP